MPSVDINWLAIIAAVAINMVIGAIWYSPVMFAKDWAKLTGRKMNEMGDGTKGYILTTIGAFVQALVLLHFVTYAAFFWPTYNNVSVGLLTATWAWLGFVAIPQGVNMVFANTRKKLWAINTGYFLVVLLINGVILASWR
ncbi:MAG TPA: DUF1761 domain-containing protein [Candidatus Saccharimonadales bacterium]|nr:DUF1761 domain-containing protein [Candidatus Saccharimonadales bacterium]